VKLPDEIISGLYRLNENEYFKEAFEVFIKKLQTREGKIRTGGEPDFYHPKGLRVLASVEPELDATTLAVRYFLENLDDFKSYQYSELITLTIGVLALWEIDYLKFKDAIEDI